MRSILTALFVLFLVFFVSASSFASSTYVLPYPGFMPGNKLYKLSLLMDKLKGYYSFGDFAQFKYNLSESDKSLVEAKTLFEYNQYPLAIKALETSDTYFKKVLPNLINAKNNGRNISEKMQLYDQAVSKHVEVLEGLKKQTPKTFLWVDEKKAPLQLSIWEKLDHSIIIRGRK